MGARFGIDVSHWQGDFNFARAKRKESVDFAILKAGGADAGLYTDSRFESNYMKCEKCGLAKGAYFFGDARNTADARKEAAYFIHILKDKKFEYPVFYDVEGDMITKNTKGALTEIVKAFCETMEKAGYWVGIYSSESFFNKEMYDAELAKYTHWVASWGKSKPKLLSGAETQMWQFGGETNRIKSNKINGITCDQDYCYVDYPVKIKKARLNGFQKKSNEELAKEVLADKWGKGEERRKRLEAAGYDYVKVQSLVNALLRK